MFQLFNKQIVPQRIKIFDFFLKVKCTLLQYEFKLQNKLKCSKAFASFVVKD